MSFEIIPGLKEAVTLDEVCKTPFSDMYLDDLGKIPQSQVVDNYLNSMEQEYFEDSSLYNKALLDTHIPASSPSDFSILRANLDGSVQSYRFDASSEAPTVLGKNSSIVNSTFVNGSLSLPIFPSFFNSLLNPIFYIVSFSNFNLPFLLLSGGYLVRPAGNSSQGGTATSQQYTTSISTDKNNHANLTTGTLLGHNVGNNNDDEDPQDPSKFKKVENPHYTLLTETELQALLRRIFLNQVERMSEKELLRFLASFDHFHNISSLYELYQGSTLLYRKKEKSDYLVVRSTTDSKGVKCFVKKKSSKNLKSSNQNLSRDYILIHDFHLQSLIASHIKNEQRNSESLASTQSSISSFLSSSVSSRSFGSRPSIHYHNHNTTTASAAPVTAASASNWLQTWLPILIGMAGSVLLAHEFSRNRPFRRNREGELRNQGLNRGKQDFVDDVVQANNNRPLFGLGTSRIPVPILENDVSSLSLDDENTSTFRLGQAEGYRVQKRDHQREHPKHKAKINEITRPSTRANQVEFNTGTGFSINHQALLGILFEIAAFALFRRNPNSRKNKKENQ